MIPKQWVPEFGPWFMRYAVLPGTFGVMLSTSGQDVTLSGGLLGRALVVGWRFRRQIFPDHKFLLGRER